MAKTATILFFLLIVFGLVMLASAGVVEGQKKCGSSHCYLLHQIEYGILPGILAFIVFSNINYKRWKTFALPLLIVALLLLLLVFVPGIGRDIKGAQRWVDLRIASIQPSEFLKFALIVYLAAWFGGRQRGSSSIELIPFFLILGFTAFLLILEPDFGTLGIIMIIGVALYFFSGAKLWHFLILMLAVAVLMGTMALAAPYRFNRIKTFFNPQEDTQGSSYHINQSLITIGSGGMWGLGYGQSKQKFNYLPEPVGDSIFAITVEELGFVGGTAVLATFLILLIALAQTARNVPDAFGRLFILGVAVWIGGQSLVNISSITGLIPLTGVPLPLISYGGSSLVSLMAAMGIVKNISKVGT